MNQFVNCVWPSSHKHSCAGLPARDRRAWTERVEGAAQMGSSQEPPMSGLPTGPAAPCTRAPVRLASVSRNLRPSVPVAVPQAHRQILSRPAGWAAANTVAKGAPVITAPPSRTAPGSPWHTRCRCVGRCSRSALATSGKGSKSALRRKTAVPSARLSSRISTSVTSLSATTRTCSCGTGATSIGVPRHGSCW
jgi:hypothetical protein